MYFRQKLSVSLFSDVPDGSNSSVGRGNNFIQGTWVLLSTSFVNTAQVYGGPSLRSIRNKRKALVKFQFIWVQLKTVLAVMLRTAKLNNNIFGLLERLEN